MTCSCGRCRWCRGVPPAELLDKYRRPATAREKARLEAKKKARREAPARPLPSVLLAFLLLLLVLGVFAVFGPGCAHFDNPFRVTPMGSWCSDACDRDAGHVVAAAYDADANECVCYGPRGALVNESQVWRIPGPRRVNSFFAKLEGGRR